MPKIHVTESIEINAPAQRVYDVVADFGTWTTWSPWLCAEPNATVEVTDDASSIGSIYSWCGDIVGEGEIEHASLHPAQRIDEKLRFLKPFKSKADVSFRFERSGESTKVSWVMDSSLPWFLFWMKSNMESMIGMDYERGLKMLKEWIETGDVLSDTQVRGVESVGPIHMVGSRQQCDMSDIDKSMEVAFAEAIKVMDELGLDQGGEKMAVYHHFNPKQKTFDYSAGFVVPTQVSSDASAVPSFSQWSLPATKALSVEHLGSYDNLGNSWSAAYQYARHKKLKPSDVGTFEIYKNDPDQTAKSELRTDIMIPLK